MTHNILEWANLVSAWLWLSFVITFILLTEYWHRIRGEIITAFSDGWKGIVPSILLVIAVIAACTTAITRLLMIWF